MTGKADRLGRLSAPGPQASRSTALTSAWARLLAGGTRVVRQKVLVVDDLPINRAFVAGVLEDECDVLTASTGTEALQLAVGHRPDLILLDIQLADLHGFEVCRRLKADPLTATIPVIFLTAMSDEMHEADGLGLGAIDFIAKPFSGPVLRARVRNHLELVRQRAALQRLTNQDGLTGIANRRAFDTALVEQWRYMARLCQPLAVLLIDVDHFKAYNDTQGHLAGDACLRQVAEAIDSVFRQSDGLAARYGGEEFVCLMTQADEQAAVMAGERFAAAVRALAIAHPASPTAPVVTVSVGCAARVPVECDDPQSLLALADKALYAAKDGGRDQVCVAQGSGHHGPADGPGCMPSPQPTGNSS